MNKEFNNALGNFINEFANGGIIRHMIDAGYTIDEIASHLDFHTPKATIAQIVFKHYVDNGKVSLIEPTSEHKKVSFIQEQDSYGRLSMRRVVEESKINPSDYIHCDFGRQLYKYKDIKFNNDYPDRIKDHIRQLPWPLEDVWIRKDLFEEK